MGILNVTPDSFSDGGRHAGLDAAVAHARQMVADGADWIDIGGESTRPGAADVSPEEEQARVVPVIAAIRDLGVPISIDTRNAATMRAAVMAGAAMVNDVSALAHDPDALATVAELGCQVVLMHMRGTPATMAGLARYTDLVADVRDELAARLDAARRAGIAQDRIVLDPGLGFAKNGAQNTALLRGLPALAALGCPLLVGASRKKFIGEMTGQAVPDRRDPGSLAVHLFAASQGAAFLRAHDVAGTVQAIRMWQELHV